MNHVQALGALIDKVKPLQDEKKMKQEQLIKALEKKTGDEKSIEHNGRIYTLKYAASKPPLNRKFLDEAIKMYNAEKKGAVPDEFLFFLLQLQAERKKEPKPRLSITKV
jgi:hypothetical protein